ncbi:pentatricopeptide repeat protein [Aspergillus ellipticus CBS 707.79]|uniref:Pentatricopeptide repeat protein n=1 Tax=Aspergillus ellipticus CBS 707.79 TaxID=1448320 RepID=A0A319D7G4_9EURO|nr:pentatricopeptide repeat protein [Aspergillus ellipticus CBS 707.79]
MVSKPASSPPAAPSRNALRVLRRLALAGSTVGGFCAVAALTYDAHRRVRIAERIVENKRALRTSAPNYDATSAARRLARMIQAAEAGEFMGLDSMKEENEAPLRNGQALAAEEADTVDSDLKSFEDQNPLAQAESLSNASSSKLVNSVSHEQTRENSLSSRLSTNPRSTDALDRAKAALAHTAMSTNKDVLGGMRSTTPDGRSVSEQMQNLLDRGRSIEAANLFLDAHPAKMNGISSDRREVAVKIFYLSCKEENVGVARNIFERLEKVDKISHGMWKVLMFALARRGSIETVASVFTRYMHTFKVPPELVDIVLRCLLESHRLTTAKWFLFRNLTVDRNCGLCGAYLAGLWKKTRNIELINGQLKKLLTVLPRLEKPPTDKLFNPVIKAYIDFGRVADAEALAQEMITTYGIPLHCRTKGLLVFARALSCDWEGVDAGLQEMHDLKLTSQRDFLPIFDRLLLEYWVSHSGPQIRDFVYRYIELFDLVPDKVLYKHILEAFVEKGNREMMDEFLRYARERRWPNRINEEEFLEMLRARRHALEESPVGFWHMLQAARQKYGQAATSQQILGYDQRSFPSPQVNIMPYTKSSLPWYQRTMQPMTPSRPVDQYQKLHKQMSHYMHSGKLNEALKCFQNAKNAKFQVKQLHVELAVVCTLLTQGLPAARALIDAEWRNIREFIQFFPQFFRQLMEIDSDVSEGELIKMAVLRFYELCWSNKRMTVKHHITIATCRRLVARGDPELAVDLLTAVYMSKYQRSLSFDGVCMKMYLRAFSATNNVLGMRWCLLTALARGSALNHSFLSEVRRVTEVLRRELPAASAKTKKNSRQFERAEYFAHIAGLLARKCDGDPEAWKLKINLDAKMAGRRALKRPLQDGRRLYSIDQLPSTIERWDEPYELDTVLGRFDTDASSVAIRWSEKHCLGQVAEVDDLL